MRPQHSIRQWLSWSVLVDNHLGRPLRSLPALSARFESGVGTSLDSHGCPGWHNRIVLAAPSPGAATFMTDVIARSPLHPFPMASVERPARRRSARLETDEDARPTKKPKLDNGSAPLKTPGRKHATNSKKSAACMSPHRAKRRYV